MENQFNKLNLEPKHIKPFLESLQEYNTQNPSIQFIPKNFSSSSVSGIIDRFTIDFVHCTIVNFSLSVLFDLHRIESPPDLILPENEEFMFLWSSLDSISKWNCSNKKSLLLILQDIFGLYKNQQMNIFTTIKSNNLNDEYASTFEIEGSEFCIRTSDLAVVFHIPIKNKKEYLLFIFKSPYLKAKISIYDHKGKELKNRNTPNWKYNSSIFSIKNKYEKKNQFSNSYTIKKNYTQTTSFLQEPIIKNFNSDKKFHSKYLNSRSNNQTDQQQYPNKEKNYFETKNKTNNYPSSYKGNSTTLYDSVSRNNNIYSNSKQSTNGYKNDSFTTNNNSRVRSQNQNQNQSKYQRQNTQKNEVKNFDNYKNKRKSFINKLIQLFGNPIEYDSILFHHVHFLITRKKGNMNFLLNFHLSEDFPELRPIIKIVGLNYIKANEEILFKPIRLKTWGKFIDEEQTMIEIQNSIQNYIVDFELYVTTQLYQRKENFDELQSYLKN
ncbi:brisc and brca1-a complex member [Anaeramoeba flamelloides]|uniref:BRISC and BRCA1-A complex member 2 n=1 Tax=Anaeramoeba flamelloides TaxID=1746091 RepID=A0AAV8A5U1_9EUKA|nr:brisc and brca1-a complex member [Anaeramoeba flamelloides]